MARIWNRFRQYERHVMIGLVIVLLATFSISGVLRGRGGAGGRRFGGTFQVVPGKTVELSDDEFEETLQRYAPFVTSTFPYGPMWAASLRYGPDVFVAQPDQRLDAKLATWIHVVTVEAARAAGYDVSDEELKDGIEAFVTQARPTPRGRPSRAFSPELYDQVLAEHYRYRTKVDFEKTVREILLKDKFLAPLLDSTTYVESWKRSYEEWKASPQSSERVDLAYVAVPADQFRDAVATDEDTRTAIARVEAALAKSLDAWRLVQNVTRVAENLKSHNDGKVAKDAKELATHPYSAAALGLHGDELDKDPWGKPVVYRTKGDGFEVLSAGADGKEDTADDVGPAVAQNLSTLTSVRQVAEALVDWQRAAEKWPESLDLLTKAPPKAKEGAPQAPAPLASVPKDAWGKDLAWDAAAGTVTSAGPDGAPGTADDVAAKVAVGSARVPLPKALEGLVPADAKDAWGKPLSVRLKKGPATGFEVSSAGADGVEGTDDDVTGGNANDVQTWYAGKKSDYMERTKRQFEVLHVSLPRIPDTLLARAWKAHPEWHPSEVEIWDFWRKVSGGEAGDVYRTRAGSGADAKPVDPADPKEGHGAAHLEALKKAGKFPADAKGWLVPSGDAFGPEKDPPKEKPPATAADPKWVEFTTKGWRHVLMREFFVDKALGSVLARVQDSRKKHKEWEKTKTGPEPEVVTFDGEIERLADLKPNDEEKAQGGQFLAKWAASGLLTSDQWEADPEVGSVELSSALNGLAKGDYGALGSSPVAMHAHVGRALVHAVDVVEQHDLPLEEARPKFWPKYLESRAMARAAKVLEDVRAAAGTDKKLGEAAKAVSEKKPFRWTEGTSGLFVGTKPPPRTPAPEGDDEKAKAEKAKTARRSYVRQNGYATVAASQTAGAPPRAVGMIGRYVLRDETKPEDGGTGNAYLVQLAALEEPTPEEFGARRFATEVREKAYAKATPGRATGEKLSSKSGSYYRELARWFDDWDDFKRTFAIRPHTAIEVELSQPRTRTRR
jgi:hypothetical protein